jgi:CO/xanthine dehydrogenase FAD-binding subunit
MKPPPFEYVRPASLDDAVNVLAEAGEDAKVLAGGQSLVPMLNFRLARPSALVDIAAIPELLTVEQADGMLVIGAAVRQRTIETSDLGRRVCPLLGQALAYVGHLQIRSRGTIGGSIAHADPAAELAAVALVLDAEFQAQSLRGVRSVGASEFFTGPYTTVLADDEILTQVSLPLLPGWGVAFVEFARRAGDFALAGVAAAVRTDEASGAVAEARLAAIGVGSTPERLRASESVLVGRALTEDVRRFAGAAAAEEVSAVGSHKADAAYRSELLSVLVARALEQVNR